MSGIRISKEFGVNPSVQTCPICGKDMGIIMFGTSYKDENGKTAQAPRQVCTHEVCDDCDKVLKDGGVFIIEVRDGEKGPNPYRTGRLVALKREAAERIFKQVHPVAYMEKTPFSELFDEYLKDNAEQETEKEEAPS